MKKEIAIRPAETKDAQLIQSLAEETWWPTYTNIISKEQIRYMLDTIYSLETISHMINSGEQEFVILEENKRPVGFAAFSERTDEPGIFKLHKLYVLPETQGKGYGISLIEEVKRIVSARSSRTLDLNVNRYNPAKSFYEKLGFTVVREEDIPIGAYWMNDFVMRLEF
jgi:ribosomal protein S18 acetylase RimI-like enzyme